MDEPFVIVLKRIILFIALWINNLRYMYGGVL